MEDWVSYFQSPPPRKRLLNVVSLELADTPLQSMVSLINSSEFPLLYVLERSMGFQRSTNCLREALNVKYSIRETWVETCLPAYKLYIEMFWIWQSKFLNHFHINKTIISHSRQIRSVKIPNTYNIKLCSTFGV